MILTQLLLLLLILLKIRYQTLVIESKKADYEEKNIRHWDLYLILNTKIKENRLDDKSDNSWLIDNSDLD